MKKTNITAFVILMIMMTGLLAACSKKEEPIAEAPTAVNTSVEPAKPTEIPRPRYSANGYPCFYNDSEEYAGEVELYDKDYPMILTDDVTYALVDDHAEVIYTTFSNDKAERVAVLNGICLEGKEYPVTVVAENAFYAYDSLKSVSLSDNIIEIRENAFNLCSELTFVKFPANVKSLGTYSFWSCTSLKEIEVPASVEFLGEGVFADCDGLEKVVFANKLDSLPLDTFSGCSSLKEVVFPEGLTTIEEEVFWDCETIDNLVIPEGVTFIGDSAFYNCMGLKNISLPASLDEIGDSIFMYCENLERVTCATAGIRELVREQVEYDTNAKVVVK